MRLVRTIWLTPRAAPCAGEQVEDEADGVGEAGRAWPRSRRLGTCVTPRRRAAWVELQVVARRPLPAASKATASVTATAGS
jgi:hypothetical protein